MPQPRTPERKSDPAKREPWRIEGDRDKSRGTKPPMLPRGRRLWTFILVLLVVNLTLSAVLGRPASRMSVPYTFFRTQVERGHVKEVTSQSDKIQGDFIGKTTYQPPDGGKPRSGKTFQTVRPSLGDDKLIDVLLQKGVVVNAKPLDQGTPLWQTLIFGFGPTLLLVGIFVWIARRAATAGGAGGLAGLGRSRAKRYEASEQRTTFEDVAGIDEAKAELVEIVDFLRNPDRYRRLGGTIPKGVLLSGPPGTGKTLLARAVAGEADVPFFSMSASEFVEMVVGVGASRVRDLFEQAKKVAPAIIFIDELDAIGQRRGGGGFGGHDEREQTLNQILTEMDGFTGTEGVIVLAATNRPETLDAALLRPGRFDRRITVNPPDQRGREAILTIHTRDVPLADDVDLSVIASNTPGMVGADLRNLVNEAALIAARRNRDSVTLADFNDALERIVLGAARKIMMTHEERERTAYHESGHAVLGMLDPTSDPVRKVSIVPRGRALGVTFQSPETDRYGYDTDYLRGRITGALGGRAAEEIIYGKATTGAESDLEQVTSIARQMVGRWGMSQAVGLVAVLPRDDDGSPFGANPASEATRELIDTEVRRIVDECYESAVSKLQANRERLESLSKALLEHETLDEEDAYRAAGFEPRISERRRSEEAAAVSRSLPETAGDGAA
ncbi:MAG: cell division protease FtsH [Thermoleophilales bacterium]|nr:cell division protease FtsH [Thermoleophilales bacterium]